MTGMEAGRLATQLVARPLTARETYRAARFAAECAADAAELREFLDALGLDPAEIHAGREATR